MKKKVLIVSDSLNMGGLEKCLLNVCDNFDYSRYDVDLYLFNEGSTLLDKLNKNVNLLPKSPYYKDVYNTSVFESIKILLKKKKISFALYRFIRFLRIRFKDYTYRHSDWKVMQKTMLKLDTKYDVAIGFAEGTSCYYVANCVNADVRIGWIHTDLKKVKHNLDLDRQSFEKLDKVATVSQNSLNSLMELFPGCKDKFVCIKVPTLINYNEIEILASEPNFMDDDKENVKILSVGRLVELKGFHLCIEPCKRLLDDGFKIKWYIAGEGDYRPVLENLIKEHHLEDSFVLLGNCSNPYTYIRSADIGVQPSSYEGFGMSVFEGKYFRKPMVVSNIPSYLEMIEHEKNGLIVKRDSDEIYMAVKRLLSDEELRKKLGEEPVIGGISNKKIMQEIESLFVK